MIPDNDVLGKKEGKHGDYETEALQMFRSFE